MIFYFSILVSLVSFQGIANANSLEEVDDKELNKLLNQEQYVAVLFSKLHKFETYLQLKCKQLIDCYISSFHYFDLMII